MIIRIAIRHNILYSMYAHCVRIISSPFKLVPEPTRVLTEPVPLRHVSANPTTYAHCVVVVNHFRQKHLPIWYTSQVKRIQQLPTLWMVLF